MAAHVLIVRSVNAWDVLALLWEDRPQLAFCYGTGKVCPKVFNTPPGGIINLHGGILPQRRGLDANLWAAFEGHPYDMGVTLHQIDEDIDTGAVYQQMYLSPEADLSVVTLRYHTTVLATAMACDLLKMAYQGSLWLPKQQAEKGRYYSLMPFLYKPLADWRIRKWIGNVGTRTI